MKAPALSWPPVTAEAGKAGPGRAAALTVTIPVPDGCHIQSHTPADPFLIPTSLTLEGGEGLRVERIDYPREEEESFDWSPTVLRVYRGPVEIVATVRVGAGAARGRRKLAGRVRYQGCTDRFCLPPVEQDLEVELEVV